ncbi:MAG: hypothetical protein ACK5YW_02040 [Betaproteobacteria bacterium]|nr:hypothetical protein [Rhodocyclaceae bacterium]MCA3132974.1 hypothetical protein [Rhodocyclaceae bacterium]MCA3141947.1 hypothetical protein [Rhodocyclaceae bacterium]MCA3144855.1 hypothetical protein [Rhodocyclaceae bacterium]MCE2898743.1 hypothetical protein [Betaproteobacteria bacterium]
MKCFKPLLLLALLLGVNTAFAQEKFILDQKGCKVINPSPRPEETVTWSGACGADGYTTGKGVLQWFQSGIADEKYEGEMARGYAHGQGTQTMVDGGRYEGQWNNSRQDGEGAYFAPDGSVYRGGWKNGQPHGQGTYRTPEGRVTQGEWENGRFKGEPGEDPNRT